MIDRGEFAAPLMELHVEELEINDTKGEEYATLKDVLADFRAVAQDVDVPLRKVIYAYMLKHWRAIGSYCRRGEVLSNEPLRSRVNDLRLYSALLLAEQLEGEEARGGLSVDWKSVPVYPGFIVEPESEE